ncbi:MAG: sugar ABC transporter substrate-binding protein [Chloroflexi bacterium]|nr:MAG: sugar ABC transporter substrate-binding protein [Chloroflexota bacterium]
MFRKSLLPLTLGLLVLALVLAGCGGGQAAPTKAPAPKATEAPTAPPKKAEPVTIKVWFHSGRGEERDVLESQIQEFNTMQEEVKVEAVQLPEGSYNDQVNAAALAGDLPDLLDFDGPFMANYTWAGYLRPLDDFLSADLRDDLLPSIIAQGTYPPDGKLYCIGTFDSGLAIWGNKAYLKKAGVRIPTGVEDAWTREEFEDALAKLQALPEVEWALDLKLNYGRGEWFTYGFSPILQSMGADLIDRSTWRSTGTLNSDAAVEAMTMFQDWINKGYVVPADAGDAMFYGEKKAALAFVGHWMWTPHKEGLGDDLILLPMPKFGQKAATGMGSWCWGIPATSKKAEAAWKFLAFLLEPDQILKMTDANGAVPSRKSALEKSDLYGAGGPLNIFVQQLETIAVPRPQHPAYPTITAAFAEAVDNIIAGADVRSELDKAAQKIDQDIEDNQGYPPFGP